MAPFNGASQQGELAKGCGEAKRKTEAPLLSVATCTRARKVWGLLVHQQAQVGEVSVARAWLEEMAAQHDVALAAFVQACGLRKPRLRVKAGRGPLVG